MSSGSEPNSAQPALKRLDALHQAGRELAALHPDMLDKLNGQSRVDFLKANILRCARQLLGQDKVDIRLLNPACNTLEPLVCEGMRPEIMALKLKAEPTNNGISGWVASQGKSYYCPDARNDPLNITGASNALSCFTLPLMDLGKVIGVMSIESERLDAFTEEDRSTFLEFGQEISTALHTLWLLSTQSAGLASQSVELVSRELALPIDDILNHASALRDRTRNDPVSLTSLDVILQSARKIKAAIREAASTLKGDDPLMVMSAPPPGIQPFDLHILVVETDERYRKLAHTMLGKLGCTVETTRTGNEALAQSRTTQYDMALVDLRLSDMTGYDLFCRLRAEQPSLAVVLTTDFGYDSTHSIIRARQEGLLAVLYKPFRLDQVLEVLMKKTGRQT
ncbi:MAG TPA: response regulator [Gemmatales bacterium]|nr:response regulator [Gemmatales bacterium]